MKKSKIKSKLLQHLKDKTYTRITRKTGVYKHVATGYVLGLSDQLVLLQETDDFQVLGFQLFPLDSIHHVRFNNFDKTVDRILKAEKQDERSGIDYEINIESWQTALQDIMKTELCVISECEHEDQEYFCIGQIKEVKRKSVYIRYFDAEGILDDKNTKHKFKQITKLSFNDRYANIFYKYVKESEN